MTAKEQVLELLEHFEDKGFVLDSVEVKEEGVEAEKSAQMVLFVIIPIELVFTESEDDG